MKTIAVIGCIDAGLRIALESKLPTDVELVEVTQEQVDEDKKKIAILGSSPVGNFSPVPPMEPIDSRINDEKCTGRKSDRKRNRKNRWC